MRQLHLIVGGDSNLGGLLAAAIEATGEPVTLTTRRHGSSPDRMFLDLADVRSFTAPQNVGTAYVLGASASLDACKSNPAGTRIINVQNTVELARKLIGAGATVVFFSTASVFDGTIPLTAEDTPVSPRTEYGRQKAEAERLLSGLGGQVLIVRMTKVLFPGNPVIANWISSLSRGEPISPFMDLTLAPLAGQTVIDVVRAAVAQELGGVIHVSPKEQIRYDELALFLARRLGHAGGLVRPVASSSCGRELEHRPQFVTLGTHRIERELGFAPRSAWDEVERALGRASS